MSRLTCSSSPSEQCTPCTHSTMPGFCFHGVFSSRSLCDSLSDDAAAAADGEGDGNNDDDDDSAAEAACD